MAYVLAIAIIVVDQASKYWILNLLDLPARAHVAVAGPFNLTMVWNRGVSFGLLWANHEFARWGLAVFSIGVSILLAGWVRKAERPLMAVSLALIMGGAIGNVVDRIRFGAVADFLDFSSLFFPWIFNVADAAITTGILLLLLDMVRSERKPAAASAPGDAS
jgi:signal peptidase II